jgi:SAM-dependent methyltransferase
MLATVISLGIITVLAILLALLVIYAIYQAPRQRIDYIPLPPRGVAAVVKALALAGNVASSLVDLGCGDGRVLEAALRDHQNLRGIGVEINPLVALLARWRLRRLSGRARIIRGNLLQTDLRQVTRVFTYLNHPTMAALEAKLEQELPKGSQLVSCDFPLPTRKPTKTLKIGESWQLGQTLYIYEY